MSSDNTRDSGIIHAWNETPSSENTWLSAIAERCADYRVSTRPKGRYEDFLTVAFGEPAFAVLTHMYIGLEMSVADIQLWLQTNVGWCTCGRQISQMLKDAGVSMRGYADRKRLSWKQGKMDTALAKLREATKQQYFIGSSAEKTVRYLLQVSLAALNLPWHVVIGDQLQIILSRYEVDIPVVVVDPATGLSCRFAVEVDSTFAHGSEMVQLRDRAKDGALETAGWTVYRVNGDSMSPVHIVPQIVDVAMDIKRLSSDTFSVCTTRSGTKHLPMPRPNRSIS